MGKTANGGFLITVRPDEATYRRFEKLMQETGMRSQAQLGEYLLVKGMDAFDKDRKLGPYVFAGRHSGSRQ